MANTYNHNGRIETKFRDIHERGEGVLIAYLTGGDPDAESFKANCKALVEGGADMVEVGIPFSDPLADGPVIQAASLRALSHGATPAGILDSIRELSTELSVPFVVMSYYNPLLALGLDRFFEKARESGVDGVVVPDLPVEESDEFGSISARHNIDSIYLAAPNTSRTRMRAVLDKSRGFVYVVSLYGVTGPRDSINPLALETVRKVKSAANGRIPVAAGFGITRPEHVSSLIQAGCDGAIVGSALVRTVAQHLDSPTGAANALKNSVAAFKQATRNFNP